jgi:disulfide bond formation protein DsbB
MDSLIRGRAYSWGALTMLGALAVVSTAIGFEVIGGFVPCALCLQERWAYYAGVPAMFVALIFLTAGWPRLAAIVMAAVALGFLANAGLGVYHAGAEWGFWPGPETCGGGTSITTSAGDLLKGLQNTHVIRCDQAAGRFLGLSFAGWNVVASLELFATGLLAAVAATTSRFSGNWART